MTDRRFPLEWPTGWPRTPRGKAKPSKYLVTPEKAMTEMLRSAKLFGASNVVLSTNVPIRKDGLPYTGVRPPEDAGVALYWIDRKRQARVIACDQYSKVHENMRAIGLTLDALRSIERNGASQILERTIGAFAALPASTAPAKRTWRDVFGWSVLKQFDAALLDARYRELARERHPDTGGSNDAFIELTNAYEAAKAEIRGAS